MKSRVGAQYRRRVHPALRARIRRWRTPPPPRQEQSVSVLVIDCQGRPHQVRSCLDSVIRSSYRNIEILVITDQSSRSVASVVRSYARWDPRVKLVEQPAPLPSTSGSTSPNGQYVLVLQAPDRLEKNAVARLAKVLRLTESDFALGQFADNLGQARSADTDVTPYDSDRLGLRLGSCQAHPAADSMSGILFRSDFLADIGWTVEAAGTIDQRDLMDRAYQSGRFDLVGQRVVWQPDSDSPRPHESDAQPGATTTITMTSADS